MWQLYFFVTLFDFFVKKSRLKLAKNKTKAKQHPEAETETFYQTKIIGNILKRVQKISVSVYD